MGFAAQFLEQTEAIAKQVDAVAVERMTELLATVRERLASDLDAPGALAAVDGWAGAVLSGEPGIGDPAAAAQLVRDTVDALLGIAL